jgi:hypothetical protein
MQEKIAPPTQDRQQWPVGKRPLDGFLHPVVEPVAWGGIVDIAVRGPDGRRIQATAKHSSLGRSPASARRKAAGGQAGDQPAGGVQLAHGATADHDDRFAGASVAGHDEFVERVGPKYCGGGASSVGLTVTMSAVAPARGVRTGHTGRCIRRRARQRCRSVRHGWVSLLRGHHALASARLARPSAGRPGRRPDEDRQFPAAFTPYGCQ